VRGRRAGTVLCRTLVLTLALLLLFLSTQDALARSRRKPVRKAKRRTVAISKTPTYDAALVIEAETGTVLYQKDAYVPRAPASLAKMMLELITLEAIRAGEISLDDVVVVPADVKQVRGTRVRLRVGETVTVRDLLHATAISSANDAATALAIRLAGSTEACVARMNRRARDLGMVSTRYENVHGLDRNDEPGNITNAWDLAILARQLIAMPEALEISSTVQTVIRSTQAIHTTNRLLGRYPGCDGLKTGYTSRAGFCLVSTAERGGMRLVSVLLGAASNRRRFSESAELLDKAFNEWQRVQVVAKGQDLGQSLTVRSGKGSSVPLVAGDDLSVLVSTRRSRDIRVAVAVPASTRAPITEGWTLGRVQVLVGDSVAAECAAVAGRTVRRAAAGDWLQKAFQP
jgi:serine-type D-Ala-D-Ala carboxypeptidase (penicillin-binding protein 5/6)